MNIVEAIAVLNEKVPDASLGLPDEVFYYISRTTPLVNVDILIKDEKGRTLLSWRDDKYCGQGWHVPGGIVRFKETLATRLQKVAENEIGAAVESKKTPLAIKECILPDRDIRGHFISVLYLGRLSSSFMPENKGLDKNDAGYLQWHEGCPDDLLAFHEMYREYIEK